MAREKEPEKFQAIGTVSPREIVAEMQESYLDYAMSVIVARALPDVREARAPADTFCYARNGTKP